MSQERWDEYFLGICQQVGKNTKCLSRQIGAILVKDKSIIATGYNGPPRGIPTCSERCLQDSILINALGQAEIDIIDAAKMNKCPRQILGFKSGKGLEWCVDGNTKIKLLKGEEKTIAELAENNQDEWVYSIDTETLEIVPALAKKFRMIGIRDDLVEVTLDDGSSFRVTQDHKMLLKNGTYKEAGKLCKDDRLMPMYYCFHNDYEIINNYGRYKSDYGNLGKTNAITTENLVYKFFNQLEDLSYNDIIHHKDKNKRNNTPENLQKMTRSEHSRKHILERDKLFFQSGGNACIEKRKQNYDKFINECSKAGKKSMIQNWDNQNFVKLMRPIQKTNGKKTAILTNSDKDIIKKRTKGRIIKSIVRLLDISNEKVNEKNYQELCNKYSVNVGKGYGFINQETVQKYFRNLNEAIEIAAMNHKVVSISFLNISVPVYDVEVPKYHNFAIDLGNNSTVFAHNCVAGHAERNCLINAARTGVCTMGVTMYMDCNVPCTPCLVEIINAGVKEIVVKSLSYYDISAEYLLNHSNLKVRLFECIK